MTDRLIEVGREFQELRAESTRLRNRLEVVRSRITELRPEIQRLIIEAARAGARPSQIRAWTGYDRERIRKILREAGIDPAE